MTTGGTIEKIDAVRFISNYSTGKMGYAIARELAARGAEVTIIRASVEKNLIGSIAGVKEISALSAQEMYNSATSQSTTADIIVSAAAVADYTPINPSELKIKKMDSWSIELTPTKDIAATIGKSKREGQLLIGFALESHSEMEYAQKKLEKKNLDFIVLNSLADSGAGFGHSTNKITIIDKTSAKEYPLKSKDDVAIDIVNEIERRL